jgi:hypothetical protein
MAHLEIRRWESASTLGGLPRKDRRPCGYRVYFPRHAGRSIDHARRQRRRRCRGCGKRDRAPECACARWWIPKRLRACCCGPSPSPRRALRSLIKTFEKLELRVVYRALPSRTIDAVRHAFCFEELALGRLATAVESDHAVGLLHRSGKRLRPRLYFKRFGELERIPQTEV